MSSTQEAPPVLLWARNPRTRSSWEQRIGEHRIVKPLLPDQPVDVAGLIDASGAVALLGRGDS